MTGCDHISIFDLAQSEPPADLAALLPAGLAAAYATAAARAWAEAPFLKGLIRGRRDTLAGLAAHGPDVTFAAVMAGLDPLPDDPVVALRLARRDIALVTALADLAGAWPLERVTAVLSDFNDRAIDVAIAAALAERGAPNRGLAALALGKLGSHELNYSSDVDLILIHEPDLIPRRPREEPDEAAVRIARRAVAILADQTADGYVARVDLRLRPASEITPISLSVGAAEHYYQSEALTWERVAFVRARACAGDMALGQGLLDRIRPFIWRRSLDWTAVRDIQSVSLRIRDHFEAGQGIGPGYDLKRGRGGIREIEFFAQIHQLIWGGRDPALRVPATLDALSALAAAGRIEPGLAAQLGSSYRFLRTLEHRLQMRRDEQTHEIPKLAADRAAVARLSGAADWPALERALKAVAAPVAAAYDGMIAAAAPARANGVPAAAGPWLAKTHPKRAKLLAPLIERWRSGKVRALRSEAAREAFEAALPALLAGVTAADDPVQAAARLDGFIAALPAGAQFFALLQANPRLIDLLGRLLGVTPVLADALARDPALFDTLLGDDAFTAFPDAQTLSHELHRFVHGTTNIEDLLDRVRRWTGERRFQLGAQLVEGQVDPLAAARSLSDLADAAIDVIVPAVTADFARSHGTIAGAEPVVLALGRYGGRALTHASDLDLVFLFTGDHFAVSDGAKPLAGTVYFNRLAARLTAALSVPTAAGALYEVDTRLRPWGGKGMLAVSLSSFARYHEDEAEAWEAMALTRTRIVHASPAARAQTTDVLTRLAARCHEAAALRAAVLAMRRDIADAKPGRGRYDVKLAPGGLVDLEFIVHFLQLRDGLGLTPDLPAAISALAAAGLVAPDLGVAHDLLTRFIVLLRLAVPGTTPPAQFTPAVETMLARGTGLADFAALSDAVTLGKHQVELAWQAVFGQARGAKAT